MVIGCRAASAKQKLGCNDETEHQWQDSGPYAESKKDDPDHDQNRARHDLLPELRNNKPLTEDNKRSVGPSNH